MNAPTPLENLRRAEPSPQVELPLAAEGVQRYLWESRCRAMLIEVIGDQVFVNGSVVEPFCPA